MKHRFALIFRCLWSVPLLSLMLWACSKPNEAEKENQPPGSFTVSVSNVTFNSASLTWTAATDPENESVTYAVQLNGQSPASGLSATTYNVSGLQKSTAYTGKITATDASGHSTTSAFAFNTSDSPAPSDFVLKLDASTNKSLSVSWTASTVPNETVSYDVYNGATLVAANLTPLQYNFSGLAPATLYKIKVVAKSASGKSTEKLLDAQTTANAAPLAFAAQELQHGFSYVTIKWNAAVDADNDSLSYFLNRNGTLVPLNTAPVSGVYTYVDKGLSPASSYSFSIVAKDAFGAQTASNTLQTTTTSGPESNFLFTAKNSGSDVLLEWVQPYTGQFDPATSSYFINAAEKSLATVQTSFLNLGNGTSYVKVFLSASDFPDNTQQAVKLKLAWGANESSTQSRTVNHTRYTLSATAATVTSAILKTYSNGDRGFVLKFTGDVISDYSVWNVKEVKFDNCLQPGTISLQSPGGQTVASVFGNLSESDYQYLKTKTDGYIVVQDAGGYHRLNFTYSVQ